MICLGVIVCDLLFAVVLVCCLLISCRAFWVVCLGIGDWFDVIVLVSVLCLCCVNWFWFAYIIAC